MLTFYSNLTIHSPPQQNHQVWSGGDLCIKFAPFEELPESLRMINLNDPRFQTYFSQYSEYLLRIRYICLSIEDFLSLPIKTSFKYTDLIEPTTRTCTELLEPFNHFIDPWTKHSKGRFSSIWRWKKSNSGWDDLEKRRWIQWKVRKFKMSKKYQKSLVM